MCRKCVGKANGERRLGKPNLSATKHGGVGTRLYDIWHSMKKRAKGTSNQYSRIVYKHVDLCNEWLSFEAFRDWALANGYADELSIDRIDNAKGYSPNNCRWATAAEQAQNRTTGKLDAEAVVDIRRRHKRGETMASIGQDYKTCASTINKVVKGHIWNNIEQPDGVANIGA